MIICLAQCLTYFLKLCTEHMSETTLCQLNVFELASLNCCCFLGGGGGGSPHKYIDTYNDRITITYYRNKRHIRVLYDGFKLSSGCIKATKPKGLSALTQAIDSLKPS